MTATVIGEGADDAAVVRYAARRLQLREPTVVSQRGDDPVRFAAQVALLLGQERWRTSSSGR